MIYSIQQSLTQRREDDISRIVLQERLSRSPSNVSPSNRESSASDQAVSAIIEQFHKNTAQKEDSILTKLEALLANNSGKKSDEQKELTLFSKLNELLNKAQGSTGDSPKQLVEPLAAYSDTERRGTPDYKHKIQRMEAKLEEFFRHVDARINGLARRNQNSREEPPRQRTQEGRLICYSCGRVGHVQQNCNQKSQREPNQTFERYQPNYQRRKEVEIILPAPVIISHNEGIISFTGAVRRAQETIETNTSPSMNPENKVKKDSPPDPSPSQIKNSAGCEPLMTYRHNMSLKYCEIQDIALNLTAFRILNTTLRNFLAVKSSKPQSKYCGSLTRVA